LFGLLANVNSRFGYQWQLAWFRFLRQITNPICHGFITLQSLAQFAVQRKFSRGLERLRLFGVQIGRNLRAGMFEYCWRKLLSAWARVEHRMMSMIFL
jgi:hypothetical protein